MQQQLNEPPLCQREKNLHEEACHVHKERNSGLSVLPIELEKALHKEEHICARRTQNVARRSTISLGLGFTCFKQPKFELVLKLMGFAYK